MMRVLRVADVARELGYSERFLREAEKRGKYQGQGVTLTAGESTQRRMSSG